MRRSHVAGWARRSTVRTVLAGLLVVLVATEPAFAALRNVEALKGIVAELQALDVKQQKNPSALLTEYTRRIHQAVFGADEIPSDAPTPVLSADEERTVRALMPAVARLIAEIFQRRGRDPVVDQPNDTGGLGGLFWKLDGQDRMALPPGGFEHAFSKAIAQAMLPPRPASKEEACSAVCKTLERLDEWGYDGSPVHPKWAGASRINEEGQWAFALWSMEALFVAEAAPLCPSVGNRAQLLKGMLDRWFGSGKLKPGTILLDGKFGPSGLHFSNLLLGRLRDYAKRYPELAESIPEALRTPEKVTAMHASVYGRLKGIVKDFRSLQESPFGSNLEIHTLTSFLSGMGPDAKGVMEDLQGMLKDNRGVHPVCKVPYDPVRFPKAVVNPRESAARCVPFYLANFLTGGNTAENRQKLLAALKNFGEFSGDLLFHVPRNWVHARGSRDQLAPYYYSPTVLPAVAGAQLLVNASSGPERQQAVEVLEKMNRVAMGAYIGDGRWVHPTANDQGFFGRGGMSFATTGPATAMAMVCAATGAAGAYAGVTPQELNRSPEVAREILPPPKLAERERHDSTPVPPSDVPPLRERPVERRLAEETLGENLKSELPKTPSEVAAFLRGLEREERLPVRDALRAVLRSDRSSPAFKKFRSSAGNPSDDVLNALKAAFDAAERTTASRLADPADALNAPWVKFLTERTISLHRKDQAMSLLNRLRKAAEGGVDKRGDVYALAARWAASMSGAQRERAAELLEQLALPSGDGIPPEVSETDSLVKRILVDALARSAFEGGDSVADEARDKARTWARDWNTTLREAVPGVGAIDLEREITVHEDGGKKLKTRAWIEAVIQEQGYDDFVRWANSAGGETGEKALALLSKLDAEHADGRGAPQVGIKPKAAASFSVATSSDKTATVSGPTVLELGRADGFGPSARTQLARMLPSTSVAWESAEFVRPKDLGAGPHVRLKFEVPTHGETPPAPPTGRGSGDTGLEKALASCVACHQSESNGPQSVSALTARLRTKSPDELNKTLDRMVAVHRAIISDADRRTITGAIAGAAAEPAPVVTLEKFTSANAFDDELLAKIRQARAAGRRVHLSVTHTNCLRCRLKPGEMRGKALGDRSGDLFVSVHFPATVPFMRVPPKDIERLKALGVELTEGFPHEQTLEPTSTQPPPAPSSSPAIARYESLTYPIPGNPPRIHPATQTGRPMFQDIPIGGNGKIIVAYFSDRDDPEMKRILGNHEFIELRRYPRNSPEHQHAGSSEVISFDGLGRKITRSVVGWSARQSLQWVMKDSAELQLLQDYLAAKKSQHRPIPALPPVPDSQAPAVSGTLAQIRQSEHFQSATQECLACHVQRANVSPLAKREGPMIDLMATLSRRRLDDMMAGGHFTKEQRDAMHAYVDALQTEAMARVPARAVPACYGTEADRDAKVRALPGVVTNSSVGAARLSAAKSSRGMLFYGKESVPRTWQDSDGHLLTERNATNPFMMERKSYNSDAAREFPWANAAGTDLSRDSASEKFVIPPPSGPIARQVRRTLENDPLYFGTVQPARPMMGWEFTAGTTFGEILKVKDSETGEAIPFEIRTRTFTETGWKMDVLRPFESPSDLALAVEKLCAGASPPVGCQKLRSDGVLAQLAAPTVAVRERTHYINARNFGTQREPLSLSRTADESTQKSAAIHEIPPMPPDVVRALLKTTPFKSVFGKPWIASEGGKPAGWAPTSTADFGIVPKNYFAAYIPSTTEGCMKCHDSAGRHVDNFDPHPLTQMNDPLATDSKTRGRVTYAQLGLVIEDWREGKWVRLPPGSSQVPRTRTWYNHVPGNRENLSWHPFTKAATERGAFLSDPSIFNPCLVQSGLFELSR